MPFRTLLLAIGLSALAFAGCGSDDPGLIPQEDADRLTQLVAAAGADAAAGECGAAGRAVREARQELDGLPRRTSRALERNLRDWLDHLDGKIREECRAQPQPTAEPTSTPSATPDPTQTPSPNPTGTPSATPDPGESPSPSPTEDPGTGGEDGSEEPPVTGGVPPQEDG